MGELKSNLMAGKRGLIMGVANDHSIAWGIAKMLADHGAELAFTYQGEAFGKRVKPLAESVGSTHLLPCDVEDLDSVDAVFDTLKKDWGGIDFFVHVFVSFQYGELTCLTCKNSIYFNILMAFVVRMNKYLPKGINKDTVNFINT